MNFLVLSSFLILFVILAFPQVNAQSESISEVSQKSVEITIDNEGNVEVIHQIRSSNEPKILKFVDGTVSNLEFVNHVGRYQSVEITEGADRIEILPEQKVVFVKYNLNDILILKDNYWTLNFRYLESTTFVIPNEVELFFVNDKPVLIEGKNAFVCHGCQMTLAFSLDESKKIEYVNWNNEKFLVEIISFVKIDNFQFNQPAKEISFNVNEKDQYVTIVIPLELLWEPYVVFQNDEKAYYHQYINNGTHVWLNVKPSTTGEISIIGTTVVPEFPVIAPLAIGFLIIMMVPLMKKFNLR
jgi:hypothetical protein